MRRLLVVVSLLAASCGSALPADRLEVFSDVLVSRKLVVVCSDGSRRILSIRRDPLFPNHYILYSDIGKRAGVVKPDPLYNDRWEVEVDAVVSRSK